MIGAITVSIIAAAFYCIKIISATDISEQTQAITPQRSEAIQKYVLSVKEVCELFCTRREEARETQQPSEKTKIESIIISVDKISVNEKSFEDKIMPATEVVEGHVVEIVYSEIRIMDITYKSCKVIENNHIRAINIFLQMFEGNTVEVLEIANKRVTQNEAELQKIGETVRTAPRIGQPINIAQLRFCSTRETNSTHPLLLQVVLQTVLLTELQEFLLPISASYVGETIRLLGDLKCKKLKRLEIEIEPKEDFAQERQEEKQIEESTAIIPCLNPSEQEWEYEIEKLAIINKSKDLKIIPGWVIGKPTKELKLETSQYIYFGKQEIESIRAETVSMMDWSGVEYRDFEWDAAWKKDKKTKNTRVSKLEIEYGMLFKEGEFTEDEILEYIKRNLAWAITQYPCVEAIKVSVIIEGLEDVMYHKVSSRFTRTVVEFVPEMQNLKELDIFGFNMRIYREETKMEQNYNEFRALEKTDDFSAGLGKMPFVIRPRLWKAFTSGQLEMQINKQLGLVKDHESYIRMKVSASYLQTEQFRCLICRGDFDKNDESCWIYVTGPCRHAYCLMCLNICFKGENPICYLDNIQVLKNWRVCWRIEEAGNSTYSIAPSHIETENNEYLRAQNQTVEERILVIEY